MIDEDDADRLMETAEDLADIEAAQSAREEMTHTPALPWDEVKASLDLE